jgi:DNA-binding transcriptional LysR family regulator
MDGLRRLGIFVKVAELASFSAAARELRLAQSQVSRAVRDLEGEVGAALFSRTTRAVALTSEGRRYLHGVRGALASLEVASESVRNDTGEPSGLLRVTAPVELAEVLGPIFAALARRYGALEVDALFTDRVIDLVAGGLDVGVRFGNLRSSELKAVRLGSMPSMVCASPAYLAEHGTPRAPRDLARHDMALFTAKPVIDRLVLQANDGSRGRTRVHGRIRANDLRVVRAAALAGVTVAVLPAALARPHLKSGALVRILSRWSPTPAPIHAVLPARASQAARVRVFLAALRAAFAARPRS